MKKSIVFVHLLNDYSGSPRVLQSVIEASIEDGNEATIITSSGVGFLSSISGANYSFQPYTFFKNKCIALCTYIWWQIGVFMKVLLLPARYNTVYINTMHPFGAAFAGLLRKNKIIYHIHETSIRPALLKRWLRWCIRMSAHNVVYVSNFLLKSENIKNKHTHIVYNALNKEFQNISINHLPKNTFTVLMLCSLKKYKGVDDFVHLATKLPEISFMLVLNTTQAEIDHYFQNILLPQNISIFSSTRDVHSFYKRADLVMNLSHPETWIETFGMTVAEAFSYGIPVIVPEVGGIAEIVEDGGNGFRIRHDHTDHLCSVIRKFATDEKMYARFKHRATDYSKRFSLEHFSAEINHIIQS